MRSSLGAILKSAAGFAAVGAAAGIAIGLEKMDRLPLLGVRYGADDVIRSMWTMSLMWFVLGALLTAIALVVRHIHRKVSAANPKKPPDDPPPPSMTDLRFRGRTPRHR